MLGQMCLDQKAISQPNYMLRHATGSPPVVAIMVVPHHVLPAGASHRAISEAAQRDVARQEQGKAAAWWLGEYGNVACGEVVGSSQEASSPAADQENGRLASPMEKLALQARFSIVCFGGFSISCF